MLAYRCYNDGTVYYNLTFCTKKTSNDRFGFKGEWEEETLGSVAKVVGGGTPDTNIQKYWNGKIQWFTPSEIGRDKYVTYSLRTIAEEGLSKSSAKLLPIGTILLSSRATVGECSINPNRSLENDKKLFSNDRH